MLDSLQPILENYKFPFTLRDDQMLDIDYLVYYDRVGVFLDVGLGKTVVATAVCFYHGLQGTVDQVLCLVPPVLVKQWELWIEEFKSQGVTVSVYSGTPAVRKALSFDTDFVITTLGLFKNDHVRFMDEFKDRKVAVIVDEAASIRIISTGNHKAVRDFVDTPNKKLLMLTGTPAGAHPATVYGYIALKTPDIYRDYRQFVLLHVTATDMRGNPTGFRNLDLLQLNLRLQSVTRKAEDVLDLPGVIHIPVRYELSKPHQKLYDKLIEDLLLELEDGTVIDATTQQRMYAAAQQFVLNVPEGNNVKPAGFDVLDQVIEETGLLNTAGEKLIVFSNFRKTNDAVMAHLEGQGISAVQLYGGSDSDKVLAQFKSDPKIKVLSANTKSGGCGLNLQFCRYMLFLETPITSSDYQQASARIYRSGQTRKCRVWMAVALKTLQESIVRNVLRKEDVLMKVTPTKNTLRAALTGKG